MGMKAPRGWAADDWALTKEDEVVIEATGNAIAVVRVLSSSSHFLRQRCVPISLRRLTFDEETGDAFVRARQIVRACTIAGLTKERLAPSETSVDDPLQAESPH